MNGIEEINQYIDTIKSHMESIREVIATKKGRLLEMQLEIERLEKIKNAITSEQKKNKQSQKESAKISKLIQGLRACSEGPKCEECPYKKSDCNDLFLDAIKEITRKK